MRRSVILRLSILLSLASTSLAAEYGGGSGTTEDPYHLSLSEHIATLRSNSQDWDKHFVLSGDIDLRGEPTFDPIGIDENSAFTGTFDGNDYTLSFEYADTDDIHVGFFGYIGNGSEVKNVSLNNAKFETDVSFTASLLVGHNNGGTIEDCHATGTVSLNTAIVAAGGLVGYNSGTVIDCHFSGVVNVGDGPGIGVGGLIGTNDGSVSSSSAAGTVSSNSANAYVGGLTGWSLAGSTISDSHMVGAVFGLQYVGGLVGYNFATLSNCHFAGNVYGGSDVGDVGGLVGRNGSTESPGTPGGSISLCHTTGQVRGRDTAGGLIGQNLAADVSSSYSEASVGAILHEGVSVCGQIGGLIGSNGYSGISGGRIEKCYARGDVFGAASSGASSAAGGLIGFTSGGDVNNCYATGDVGNTDGTAGGLIGYSFSPITNCHADGNVSGTSSVGGLVGRNGAWWEMGFTIEGCRATGTVVGTAYLGGLVGQNYGAIVKCQATGDVCGVDGVGGLVGTSNMFGTNYVDPSIVIRESFSTGAVNGALGGAVGGLIGYNRYATVYDSYASGPVMGNSRVGGLAGGNSKGIIVNAYAVGAVSGIDDVGGLVGYDLIGIVNNSFWDTETTGQATSAGGIGRTTAEMKQQATFTNWDFLEIWQIEESVDYPRLIWESHECLTYIPTDLNNDCKVDFADFARLAQDWLWSP